MPDALAPRRARGPRLYLADGRRILDLWLDGGRAVLGHKVEGVFLAFKNTAERGLLAPWPGHPLCAALERALSAFFAGLLEDPVPLVFDTQEALDAALKALGPSDQALWRPWSDTAAKSPLVKPAPVLVPVLPFSFPGAPLVLVVERSLLAARLAADGDKGTLSSRFPAPAGLAAALRALELLARAPDRDIPALYPPLVPLFKGEGAPWRLCGSWLSPLVRPSVAHWKAFRAGALDAGLLLPPTPDEPLCLSSGYSDGECALLYRVLSPLPVPPCERDAAR